MKLHCCAALLALATMLGGVSPQDRSQLLDPDAPEFRAAAPERAIVRLDTSVGIVDIEVLRLWSPRGADRFVALARHGYYDGTRFFRVRPGRWVQFGINGDPAVASAWRARTFPDDPFRQSNTRGTVAFAFAVPNGRSTQVFVNTADNSATHDKEPFTPFGRVISGMAHVDRINAEHGEGPGGIRAGKAGPLLRRRQRLAPAAVPAPRLHPPRNRPGARGRRGSSRGVECVVIRDDA